MWLYSDMNIANVTMTKKDYTRPNLIGQLFFFAISIVVVMSLSQMHIHSYKFYFVRFCESLYIFGYKYHVTEVLVFSA